MNRNNDNTHEANEPGFRIQQRAESETGKKGRFGGILKENPIKGFSSETLTRPLTGLFRKTGKSQRKTDDDDSQETIAAPPTNFPNMARISATIESVQINDEYAGYRDRNPETGSKLTLNEGAGVFGNAMHPLTRYFKVGDVDVSILGRSFPTEKTVDEEGPWTAQSLFNSLESRIKKERIDAKDQPSDSRSRNARETLISSKY